MYIAIHAVAERKPKAIRAAAALGMQPREFIFRVMGPVWMFAAENHDGSGEVTGLDDAILANITFGACKSLQVLLDNGWLVSDGTRINVPGWEEHEPYFTKRARDREAKRAERASKRLDSDAMSQRHRADIGATSQIEEKRVEESKQQEREPELPDELRQYEKHVQDWLAYKRERHQTYKPRGLQLLFKKMVALGPGLPSAVEESIANNYAGLFEARGGPRQAAPVSKTAEQILREW